MPLRLPSSLLLSAISQMSCELLNGLVEQFVDTPCCCDVARFFLLASEVCGCGGRCMQCRGSVCSSEFGTTGARTTFHISPPALFVVPSQSRHTQCHGPTLSPRPCLGVNHCAAATATFGCEECTCSHGQPVHAEASLPHPRLATLLRRLARQLHDFNQS